ncbi:conserved exported hypothetical protein [Candidatus Terasakiella magnetica]|uniref:Uncharacterized protein n=1 Tax=Candidatus Terasakiella magnetica TaxID=1867952 RepID=A0A1C3RF86_9PROT|nr:transporter substrate-binding domain-containing protein [Candidatus Terasakiella magnetica]SCA55874.1 conserved exported hypothetical protein [Candidatus Terasakiella magnetica]
MRSIILKTILLLCLIFQPSMLKAETWKLTAIRDWPPYMDEKLAEKSLGYVALKNILDKIDVTLEIEYLPWKRAKYLPLVDDQYIGYYCAWPEEVDKGFFASVPIFHSPIGLISRKRMRTTGAQGDLSDKSLGLVKSYVYPAPYETHPMQERVDTDATLIKFVLLGRVDYGVIDQYVYNYLIETNPELKAVSTSLKFYDNKIEEKPLVIAFRNTKENRKRAKRLAAFLNPKN